jgi:hypothetical protein
MGFRKITAGPTGWKPLISVEKRRGPISISGAGVREDWKMASMLMGREGREVEVGAEVEEGVEVGARVGDALGSRDGEEVGAEAGDGGRGVACVTATTGVASAEAEGVSGGWEPRARRSITSTTAEIMIRMMLMRKEPRAREM